MFFWWEPLQSTGAAKINGCAATVLQLCCNCAANRHISEEIELVKKNIS